jgi:hypothetical protein
VAPVSYWGLNLVFLLAHTLWETENTGLLLVDGLGLLQKHGPGGSWCAVNSQVFPDIRGCEGMTNTKQVRHPREMSEFTSGDERWCYFMQHEPVLGYAVTFSSVICIKKDQLNLRSTWMPVQLDPQMYFLYIQ